MLGFRVEALHFDTEISSILNLASGKIEDATKSVSPSSEMVAC